MTPVQLEYIVAVDNYRSFVTAAEKCFVTQPTLSMQIQKLEEELQVKIFDRSRLPVAPTRVGTLILDQARVILQENNRIHEIITTFKDEVKGTLRIGIIPTLAPYLLPPLVARFSEHFPAVRLEVWEYPTEMIATQLKRELLDGGLLATPLEDKQLQEEPLIYERFVVYTSPDQEMFRKKVLSPEDLPQADIWLLNEGHCMRNQVLNICSRRNNTRALRNLEYNTGSVETLKRLVELNGGWTVLPELSVRDLSEKQLDWVRYFRAPEPVREISLVTHRHFVQHGMMDALKREIIQLIPDTMKVKAKKRVIDIRRD